MKKFEFLLDKFQIERLTVAIRAKRDVIDIWMNALKILMTHDPPKVGESAGSITLVVGKMSRIFVLSDRGAFSMAFPFTVSDRAGGLTFGSKYYPLIDSKITSEVLSLLEGHDVLNAKTADAFFDPIADMSEHDDKTWEFFLSLLIADDGYLRLDHDPDNENGSLHPLDHVDIFYSQSTTFKVGLDRKHTLNEFVDLVNVKTNCRFLA